MAESRGFRCCRGFGLIGILVTLVLLVFLFYFVMKQYLRRSPMADQETARQLGEQGLDTETYHTVVSSTEAKLAALQKKLTARRDPEQAAE